LFLWTRAFALPLLLAAPLWAANNVPLDNVMVTDGEVKTIVPSGSGNPIYIGGAFNSVGPFLGGGAYLNAQGTRAFSFPMFSGTINALATDGFGGWYIGGNFTHVGGVPRRNMVHILWNWSVDENWRADTEMPVNAVVVAGDLVYIGGDFGTINGEDRSKVGSVDTKTGAVTSWNPSANGTVLAVYALAVANNTVYVGGWLWNIGGQARNDLAAVDATTGLATSWDPNPNGEVRALLVAGNTLYVGGNFSTIDGITSHLVAFDTTTGLRTSWNPDADNVVLAFAASGNTLYAAGWFSNIGGQSRNAIAALDMTTAAATAWNPSPNNVPVYAVSVAGNTVYAGGTFTGIGGQSRARIAALDATTGNALPWAWGANKEVRALAASPSGVFVGGNFTTEDAQTRNRLAAIDSATGTATAWNPNANYTVWSLALSGNIVYAGGDFNTIGGKARNQIAALDTTTGNATDWNPSANGSVLGVAVSGGPVYAVGAFSNIGGQTRNGSAALDPTTGLATAFDPNADGQVNCVAVSGNTVYVGGQFSNIGGASRPWLAALDATTGLATAWNATADGEVYCILVSGSTIYVAGNFINIGGLARRGVAALNASDGTAIASFDANAAQAAMALAISGDTLFIGGYYQMLGGERRSRLSAVDLLTGGLTAWNPGSNSYISSVAVSESTLYVGGGPTASSIGNPGRSYFAAFPNTAPVIKDAIIDTTEDAASAPTGMLSASDADGDAPLKFSVSSGGGGWGLSAAGSKGTLTITNETTGAYRYVPNANANGIETYSYRVYDLVAYSAVKTITVNIAPVNDAPTLGNISDLTITEDAGTQTIGLTGISSGQSGANENQVLAITAASDNLALISSISINYTSPNPTGSLVFNTAPNMSGTSQITVNVTDDGGTERGGVNTFSRSFTVTVLPADDAPSFVAGSAQRVLEDSGAQSVPSWAASVSSGPSDESVQIVNFIVSNDNNALFSVQPAISATGALTYTPAANANGIATVSVQIHDDGGTANGGSDTSAAQTFTLTVTPVNDVPSFTKGGNQIVLEDAGPQTVTNWAIAISAGPADESDQTVDFIVTTDNGTLFQTPPAISATGTLSYTPAPDANGLATVSVQIHDSGGTANGGVNTSAVQTFTIAVTPINNAPVIDGLSDRTIFEDAGVQSINLTGISSGASNENQVLTIAAVSDNPALIPNPAVTYTSPNSTGVLEFAPAANAHGVAAITVTVHDDGGTANGGSDTTIIVFSVTVLSAADAPMAQPQSLTTSEDTPKDITLVATDGDGDALTYSVLILPAHGILSGTAPNLAYIPAQDYNGPDSFSFKASDGGLESNVATVSITVTPLADPSITSISPTQSTTSATPFTLIVAGADFSSSSVVQWGSIALATTFVSSSQLTATVGTTQLSVPGAFPVTVYTPNPGGGTSNAMNFYLYSGAATAAWTVLNTNDSGPGSLRQVMADVRAGESVQFDAAVFDLTASDAATTINIRSPLPPMDKGGVTIDAQDRRVTINGSAAGSTDGLVIASDSNHIVGLTVLGFTGSGVAVHDCANNTLGGSRRSGTGPNGQGLRIANCGTYGVQISGPASTGNVVKGCWLGLSASGKDMSANLAGVLIEAGAHANMIGGTNVGERNAISGNFYEGITVSGSGSDDNTILANVVGAAAVTEVSTRAVASRAEDDLLYGMRGAVGNGSAGVFLSKSTKGTKVGGDADTDSNLIGYNGGNGVEVRSTDAKNNSARGNRISQNRNGGIALFDGSNNGIKAPKFIAVERLPSRRDVAFRSAASVHIKGATDVASGRVELFTDPGDQGALLVGRATVTASAWQIDLDVSEVDNITATFTDDSGNTSPFAVLGRAPAPPIPVVNSASTASGETNASFSYTIAASNTPSSFGATGLPAGLSIDATTGVISGTPASGGSFTVVLSATNAFGTGTQDLALTISGANSVPAITSPLNASGSTNQPFSYSITATGLTPITFGTSPLPAGVTLSDAVISGTPTTAGTYVVTIYASNSVGTANASLTITVAEGSGATASIDSDGDGVSDALEAAAGTNPNNPADAPVKQGVLIVDKTSIALGFLKTGKDSIKATLRLSLPAGFTTPNAVVGVIFGDDSEKMTLDAKGKCPIGNAAVKIATSKTGPGAVITYSLKHKDLRALLAPYGLTDATFAKPGVSATVPVAVSLVKDANKYVYVGEVKVTYVATQGKTGKASKAK
jgi:hypothetical protein